ncbi:MAG: kynureninase [Chloroflexi bacterium]|uniref:Kynureninase n=1 Tax=Candidatus Thermofonsia Clade 3 bacterium TaxID=2364212 RepID=A0A2M8QBU7_9CHLR|nr:kynureninase [Candidatus Roseilinea sp. NK_OTU-006]PJF47269.1 MAG: kynureninase [Candidatus Thermofonsia Clade 3 bacterium]RMG64678.1 MAG: kynureninase [Chloroflexota bacterium]
MQSHLPDSRAAAAALDTHDPLAAFRARFYLPEGVIYLDGNSLGPLPLEAQRRLAQVIAAEWGDGLIRSWNAAGWIALPQRIGDKLARLLGAQPGEVVAGDSTSINLFKALAAALTLRPDRRVIVSERDNFPTDLYMAQGLIELLGGGYTLRLAAADEIADAIGADTAVVMLTHVNYRTGRMHDMAEVTQRAQACGALTIWDLAHSAGAVPVDLNGAQADFAVGCGYKYLNGGPGAPAFIFVAQRHQADFRQPLAGWMGHAHPFAFEPDYRPAPGIARALCGTPPVLSLAALECGVDIALEAPMAMVRAKSLALTDLFIAQVEPRCAAHGLRLVTPREPDRRGSQVCFAHPDAFPIMQALIARGVIGDFRAPDILRFGFAPLYLRYVDVWDAAHILAEVLELRTWDRPEFHRRGRVT